MLSYNPEAAQRTTLLVEQVDLFGFGLDWYLLSYFLTVFLHSLSVGASELLGACQ